MEGKPANEELTFNTKDSVPVNMDIAVSYQLESARVPEFYTKFRADNIDTFNRALASSLEPRLLEWERLKIMREQVAKWNGKMPDVFAGGGGQGLLMNIPTSKSGEGK